MEFDRGMTQQMEDVSESPCVLQAKGVPGVAYGPVLALSAEDSALYGMKARPGLAGVGRLVSGGTRLRCHFNFYGPFGPYFVEELDSRGS